MTKFLNKIYIGIVAFFLSTFSFITYGYLKKREGIKKAKVDQMIEDAKRREAGRKVTYREKTNAEALSNEDLLKRLRGRVDEWGGL